MPNAIQPRIPTSWSSSFPPTKAGSEKLHWALDRKKSARQALRMTSDIQFAARGSHQAVEEGLAFMPKFDADGLIPAMAIDAKSSEPLMLAYMNETSLKKSLELGEAVYWSRSRQEIWHKGATSGHIQKIVEIRTDCDQDALILVVEQLGAGACHSGRNSCFYRRVCADQPSTLEFLSEKKTFDPNAVYGKG